MKLQRHLASFATAVAVLTAGQSLQAQAVITSGNVILGVQEWGNLNYAGNGLRSVATNHESTFDGCPCEGWGVGISGGAADGTWGGADEAEGHFNITANTFAATGSTATTSTTIGGVLQVTHVFTPTATPYLYAVNVTITNLTTGELGTGTDGLRYTRLMDWDIEPTPFSELVTINGNGASNLLRTTDDGFSQVNPFTGTSSICAGVNVDFVDAGPCDHGARFDFGFGALGAGESRTFTVFYGVAPSEADMVTALGIVGAEDVYSFGQSSSTETCSNPDAGAGNPSCETFAFAFGGVGGTAVAPEPASIVLMATGLVGVGGIVRRRRRAA